MSIVDIGKRAVRAMLLPTTSRPIPNRSDGKFFYQAIDLPGIGGVPGVWDHRGTENVYLAETDFSGLSVIDVGPANGFWSFEMERRGAKVTAVELGPTDDWDAVPHGGTPEDGLGDILKSHVETVHNDFWTCHSAIKSSVEVKRGSAYRRPPPRP
jgi:hypothetical protein